MKIIKQGNTEIKVAAKKYGSYSIRNNNLVIYKGYKTNIYYLTYANVVIFEGYDVLALLDSFDKFINEIDGLDNQLRYITDIINKPIYRVITENNETISIYRILADCNKIEMIETSEYYGGKYAIFNKETKEYEFGLSYELAKYIYNLNK